jgi:CheY-like chemotaxis protein
MAKILVIDDSSLMRRILRQHLEQGGFEVEDWLPLSAMEIQDRIKSSAPDLVLSDYQMPGVNGLTVAKMVQKANPAIPVLILTAIRDPDVDATMEKFGVRRILHKPINAESLLLAVREVLPRG